MVPFPSFQTAVVQSHLVSSCQSGVLPNDLGDLVKQRLRQTTDIIDTDVLSSVSISKLVRLTFVSVVVSFGRFFNNDYWLLQH